MKDILKTVLNTLHGMAYAFLICSLIANYLLWTGKATRPESISDYVTVKNDVKEFDKKRGN